MEYILSFTDFLTEGKKGLTNAGTVIKTDNPQDVGYAIDFTDSDLEIVRRRLYDVYTKGIDSEKDKKIINKCVSTVVYCLDKHMRIDGEIIELLAKTVGKDYKKVSKEIEKEIADHFGQSMNHYGMKG